MYSRMCVCVCVCVCVCATGCVEESMQLNRSEISDVKVPLS